ncbi:hypothetical protein M997_1701 [Proteus hauseri ATCC 700826]|uniref:Uncharacterized protein n=1 Tax=Proteus hauseri ATCC 700826 TaxID=1354271 RepID=A0AAJ3HSF5_PROHU|nr:hypothetical protein M997_1701 [Proteus hauseri ATCC 700826]
MILLFEIDVTKDLSTGYFLAKYKNGALLSSLNISQYKLIQIFINQAELK